MKQAWISHRPARLRKKIEWVSLMLRLSSSTNVLPSARAQCNMDANDRNKRTLLSKSLNLLWLIVPVRLLDDDIELDRFVCMTTVTDAILLQKSTSALAVDFTLTPRSSQSQRGTRLLSATPPMGGKIYYKTDNHGRIHTKGLNWVVILIE